MNDNANSQPAEEIRQEPSTVELEDGSLAPRYGVMPYGGVPAADDAQQNSEEH